MKRTTLLAMPSALLLMVSACTPAKPIFRAQPRLSWETPILATLSDSGGKYRKPLLWTVPADRAPLLRLGSALAKAVRLGPPEGYTEHILGPVLKVGLANHQVHPLYEYYQGHLGTNDRVVWLLVPNEVIWGPPLTQRGSVTLSLLKSKELFDLLTHPSPTEFPPVKPLVVKVKDETISVSGDGIAAPKVTIRLSPLYQGGSPGQGIPGSFDSAKVPVIAGHYHWTGRFRLPNNWKAFRPVISWGVWLQVPPALPGLAPLNVGQGRYNFAVPVLHIRTASDVLTTVAEEAYPDTQMFPVWPSANGVTTLHWQPEGNLIRFTGSETTRVTPGPEGFQVDILLQYRDQDSAAIDRPRKFEVKWGVTRDGKVKRLAIIGRPPAVVAKSLMSWMSPP